MTGRVRLAVVITVTILALSCASGPAPPNCTDAIRVTREAMGLIATSARDESTKLKRLVRDGWQTSYDDLTISRSAQVGECRADGSSVKLTVTFDVVGRLVAAGQGDRVAFEPGSRLERRELSVVNEATDVKIDDLRSLEPHVEPAYAIRILTEIANGEPKFKEKCSALIAQIRAAAGSASPDGAKRD